MTTSISETQMPSMKNPKMMSSSALTAAENTLAAAAYASASATAASAASAAAASAVAAAADNRPIVRLKRKKFRAPHPASISVKSAVELGAIFPHVKDHVNFGAESGVNSGAKSDVNLNGGINTFDGARDSISASVNAKPYVYVKTDSNTHTGSHVCAHSINYANAFDRNSVNSYASTHVRGHASTHARAQADATRLPVSRDFRQNLDSGQSRLFHLMPHFLDNKNPV